MKGGHIPRKTGISDLFHWHISCSITVILMKFIFPFPLLSNNCSKEGGDSFQKGGRGQTHTAYVRGFDKSLGVDEVLLRWHLNCSFRIYFLYKFILSSVVSVLQIRGSLEQHFGSCGEITRLSVPKDYETGEVKGFVLFFFFYLFCFIFICFKDNINWTYVRFSL